MSKIQIALAALVSACDAAAQAQVQCLNGNMKAADCQRMIACDNEVQIRLNLYLCTLFRHFDTTKERPS